MEPYTREGLARREKAKKGEAPKEDKEEGEEGEASETVEELPHLPQAAYEFQLRGVLIHRGSADSGHYYSFIKDRGGTECWYEFNDDIVRPFNAEALPRECFGGTETVLQYNEYTKSRVRKTVPVTRNAYMLIYERKLKMAVEGQAEKKEEAEPSFSPSSVVASSSAALTIPEKPLTPVCVPASQYEQVWKENMKHQQVINSAVHFHHDGNPMVVPLLLTGTFNLTTGYLGI
mgnify:CR=1 FL=1